MLRNKLNVVSSPQSYNSQIGVPLSLWNIDPRNDIGVFEAGISKVDEMSLLQEMIQPTIGVFTNLGSAHDEGFESRELWFPSLCRLRKMGAEKLIELFFGQTGRNGLFL